jgi:hypothetical protein
MNGGASVLTEDRRRVLDAIGETIGSEAHNLSRWPDLLWLQLYNRLQWEDECGHRLRVKSFSVQKKRSGLRALLGGRR